MYTGGKVSPMCMGMETWVSFSLLYVGSWFHQIWKHTARVNMSTAWWGSPIVYTKIKEECELIDAWDKHAYRGTSVLFGAILGNVEGFLWQRPRGVWWTEIELTNWNRSDSHAVRLLRPYWDIFQRKIWLFPYCWVENSIWPSLIGPTLSLSQAQKKIYYMIA